MTEEPIDQNNELIMNYALQRGLFEKDMGLMTREELHYIREIHALIKEQNEILKQIAGNAGKKAVEKEMPEVKEPPKEKKEEPKKKKLGLW
jgi:tRNA isopentenyl-2-thiomethyl-A-37 hydroxylase MiaE